MRVNVYTHERTDAHGRPLVNPRPPLVLAYTRYQGEGACVHDIQDEKTWKRATSAAIKQHRDRCLEPTP